MALFHPNCFTGTKDRMILPARMHPFEEVLLQETSLFGHTMLLGPVRGVARRMDAFPQEHGDMSIKSFRLLFNACLED